MFKKVIKILLCIGASSLLAACWGEGSSAHISKITEVKLADGTTTRLGYVIPEDSWQCKQVAEADSAYVVNAVKGILSLAPDSGVMEDQAVAYANQHKIKSNYILIYLPSQWGVGIIPVSQLTKEGRTDRIQYFNCVHRPKIHDKFSIGDLGNAFHNAKAETE